MQNLLANKYGRTILPESAYAGTRYDDPVLSRRRQVLRETLERFEQRHVQWRALAEANVRKWGRAKADDEAPLPWLQVHRGDWGDVTARLTRVHGAVFGVLNMANAYCPGGAYVEGTAAQEENMFRRTDCHFSVARASLDAQERYDAETTAILQGRREHVLLDMKRPRICVRGSEDRAAVDLGYRWLADDEVFAFYELRAAAQDLRGGRALDLSDAASRIAKQLDTLIAGGLRHAVLSAFGCGAFRNPAPTIARLYKEALVARRERFDLVAFAIFAPGYGPDNYTPFAEVLSI